MIKRMFELLPLVLFAGCSNPADNTPEATVKPAAEIKESAPVPDNSQIAGTRYAIQPESKLEFVGSKVTGSHTGGFGKIAGEFIVRDGNLTGSGHRVLIDVSSIWTDSNRLTGHLKSPDFFDAAQYPVSTFATTSIEKQGASHIVSGNLTLHGITKNISFPATIAITDDLVTVNAEFHINRFDFDMKYSGKADDLIRPEVVLRLDIKATPGNADLAAFEASARSSLQ